MHQSTRLSAWQATILPRSPSCAVLLLTRRIPTADFHPSQSNSSSTHSVCFLEGRCFCATGHEPKRNLLVCSDTSLGNSVSSQSLFARKIQMLTFAAPSLMASDADEEFQRRKSARQNSSEFNLNSGGTRANKSPPVYDNVPNNGQKKLLLEAYAQATSTYPMCPTA